MKIALFSAFPHELKHLKRKCGPVWESDRLTFPVFLAKHHGHEIVAAETGMNVFNIEAAFNYICATHLPDAVLSAGFGGALYYRVDIGDLVFASRYFFLTHEGVIELPWLSLKCADYKHSLINRAVLTGLQNRVRVREGSFLTLPAWAAKSRLKACMPADASFPVCDRETIHLAKLAHASNIPFFAVRSITDTLEQDIPEELFNVTDKNGIYRLSHALVLLLARPDLIPDSIKLGRNAAIASKSLWEAVKAMVEILPDALCIPSNPFTRKPLKY